MNSPFAVRLRRAAAESLPGGAFLRRDRDGALFVTDAPRLSPGDDWSAPAAAGFITKQDGGLLRLWPAPAWLARLEAEYPNPPDHFSASLFRFEGLQPDGDALALFASGAAILDSGEDRGYDRRVRRRAALALRRGEEEPNIRGGLYACALIRYLIEEERKHEDQVAGTFLL